jgi:hypothetical protein
VLIPWSAFWERNYFVDWSAGLKAMLVSNYTRGAISGLGLVNVWAALAELADMFGGAPPESSDPQSPTDPQSDLHDSQ